TPPGSEEGRPRRPPKPRRPHLDPAATHRTIRVDHRFIEPGELTTVDRRFAAAAASPPEAGGLPADTEVLRLLATAPIAGVGRVVYSSNACFLVEFEATDPVDPAHPLRGIYKPARGERPLWDFPHRTLHYREVASYLVDAALGLGIVPPSVLRDGPCGAGATRRFVHAVARDLAPAE